MPFIKSGRTITDSAQIVDGIVKTADLEDGAITNAKVSATAAIAQSKLSGAAASGANSDITSLAGLTTPLSVAQGGTGKATIAANKLLVGNGTNPPNEIATGTAGQVLESNGAGADPSFKTFSKGYLSRARAYKGTAVQTIPNATWTKVQLDTEDYDGSNEFDPTTNYRFTAAAAGYYFITAQAKILSAIGTIAGRILKNGTTVVTVKEIAPEFIDLTNLIYLAANDYIEFQVYHASGADRSLQNGSDISFISIHLESQ